MVTRFGMAEEFGMVALDRETDQYLGGGPAGQLLRGNPGPH